MVMNANLRNTTHTQVNNCNQCSI